MLNQQEMSDRLEIQDLLARYCDAIDAQDFEALDDIFASDAIVDYTAAGGARGNLTETKAYLKRALEQFTGMQHMLGLPVIKLTGDTATARTNAFNPMVVERDGQPHTFFVGVWYRDELKRIEAGWRITHRREEVSYFHNVPVDFEAVDP
jgi:ketosteroid isomerase-like protein